MGPKILYIFPRHIDCFQNHNICMNNAVKGRQREGVWGNSFCALFTAFLSLGEIQFLACKMVGLYNTVPGF